MKKTLLAIALLSAGASFAGTMGPIVSKPAISPYITGEASWTSPQVKDNVINGIVLQKSYNGWGGRLGGGIMYPYNDVLAFTTEIGGGYYGNVSHTTPFGGINVQGNIDGYDALFGAMYRVNNFDLFLQGGFMIQNYRETTSTALGFYLNNDQTAALPEIKVGGIYNVNPNWGVTVAYMHAFGLQRSANADVVFGASGTSTNGTFYNRNPSLDAVMFGLRYNIV